MMTSLPFLSSDAVVWLLKSNVSLALLYGFYRLSVSRDTFFTLRRYTLWTLYAVALTVPLLNVGYWVRESPVMADAAHVCHTAFYAHAVDITAAAVPVTPVWQQVLSLLYLAGVCLFAARMVWQLFCIVRLARRARKTEVEGVAVRVLEGKGSPFSFFGWIFLYEETLQTTLLHEVMVHEQTHVRQFHSLDTVLAELFFILNWPNPFALLMKREVRMNLEFLADESVLADGNARKTYQYHLLGLAYTAPDPGCKIGNNFVLLPIKKRIRMMNKRRTSEMGKAKYLLFAPLMGALLLVSNIETVAREVNLSVVPQTKVTKKKSAQQQQLVIVDGKEVSSLDNVKPEQIASIKMLKTADSTAKYGSKGAGGAVEITTRKTDTAVQTAAAKQESDATVYDVPDEMPQYPGGTHEMMNFIALNIKYPAEAMKNNKQGNVIVSFTIDKEGNVGDVKVVRSIDPLLDAEALRIVQTMPRWTPGKNNGQPVACKYTVPIIFKLS